MKSQYSTGNQHGAGYALQRQGEEAYETNEVWWLLDSAGKYLYFEYPLSDTCEVAENKVHGATNK